MGEGRGREDFMVVLFLPGHCAHSVSPQKPILPTFCPRDIKFYDTPNIMLLFFYHKIMCTPEKWKNRGGD